MIATTYLNSMTNLRPILATIGLANAGLMALAVFAILMVNTVALSQEHEITEAEVNSLRGKALSMLQRVPYRERMVSQEFADVRFPPKRIYGFIKEVLPPDGIHFMFYSKTGNVENGSETIVVRNKAYSRVGSDPWKNEDSPQTESGSPDPPEDMAGFIDSSVTVSHKRNVKIRNITSDFYEIVKQYKYGVKKKGNVNTYAIRYWFDGTGRIIRAQYDSSSSNSRSMLRRTSDYDYDQSINIEAPIN